MFTAWPRSFASTQTATTASPSEPGESDAVTFSFRTMEVFHFSSRPPRLVVGPGLDLSMSVCITQDTAETVRHVVRDTRGVCVSGSDLAGVQNVEEQNQGVVPGKHRRHVSFHSGKDRQERVKHERHLFIYLTQNQHASASFTVCTENHLLSPETVSWLPFEQRRTLLLFLDRDTQVELLISCSLSSCLLSLLSGIWCRSSSSSTSVSSDCCAPLSDAQSPNLQHHVGHFPLSDYEVSLWASAPAGAPSAAPAVHRLPLTIL